MWSSCPNILPSIYFQKVKNAFILSGMDARYQMKKRLNPIQFLQELLAFDCWNSKMCQPFKPTPKDESSAFTKAAEKMSYEHFHTLWINHSFTCLSWELGQKTRTWACWQESAVTISFPLQSTAWKFQKLDRLLKEAAKTTICLLSSALLWTKFTETLLIIVLK